ncbi:MAG: hypothetical protein V4721_10605 [Bacteroidota bacterium]
MKKFKLTKIERLVLIGICIEAGTGVIGVSVILTEGHPYLTIAILALGAIATKAVAYIEKKQRQSDQENELDPTMEQDENNNKL